MNLLLDDMTILDGFANTGDVELNFYKDAETDKIVCIELNNRRANQCVSIDFKNIDNMIDMLQKVKQTAE